MKIKLAVLFGGRSVEHEISIISALQACEYIDRDKYEVIPLYMTKEGEFYTGEQMGDIERYRDIPALLKESTRVLLLREDGRVNLVRYPMKKFGSNVLSSVDVVFPIVHGTNVEDGTLQGYLQTLGLPYVGCDVLSSAVGMNKYVMKTVFKDNDIPVLDCLCCNLTDFADVERLLERIEAKFPYPVIVKPINLGSSVGISKASDRAALEEALSLAFTFAQKVLVEPAIQQLKEINCAVLGDELEAEASECEEPLNAEDILTYEDKYVGGGKGGSKGMASLSRAIPANISPERREEIRQMAVKAFQCLGCSGVARIDFMIDKETDRVYLNEINTIPGSLAFYLWEPLGLKYPQLLERMIQLALKRHRENEKLTFSFETNVLAGVKLGGSKGAKGSKLNHNS
ncbi:MAG: D-alanine--D-alanine ligase [bacterium]|nr:D-alanine--D-alanine ligase [bacterium]MCM1376316.1 D-alanine--D-alanine ligase [Muribaculum sp.]